MFTPNRKERRKLRKGKNSDKIENIKRGKLIHQENIERQERLFHEILEREEISQIKHWRSLNYSEADIIELRSAWYVLRTKSKTTKKEDVKNARKVFKTIRNKYI